MKKIWFRKGMLSLALVVISIAAAVALAGTPADTATDPAPAATESATAVPTAGVPTADATLVEPAACTPVAEGDGDCYGNADLCRISCSCGLFCKRFCDPSGCCHCVCW